MHKRMFLVFFIWFSWNLCVSAQNKSTLAHKPEVVSKNTGTIEKRDTVVLVTANDKTSTQFDWQKSMPWIGAILVGILTVGANIIISKISQKSSSEVAKRQIDNANVIALAQIELSRSNAERDFNKTVLSGNRQVWITDLRDIISQILSALSTFSLKQTLTNTEFEKLRYLLLKAELMLYTDEHKNLVGFLIELKSCCYEIMMQNKTVSDLDDIVKKIKSATLIILSLEWEKVKEGR